MAIFPFEQFIGVRLIERQGGEARLTLSLAGCGGDPPAESAITTLIDAATAEALRSALLPGETLTTVELKSNFLQRVPGPLEAYARVVHRDDRGLAYVEAEVRGQGGGLAAKGAATLKIFRPRAATEG